MAVKFVARKFNSATRTSTGADIRNFKGTNDARLLFTYPHHAFHDGVIAEEATHPIPPPLLTCSSCGCRKGHGVDGFCDQQFDQQSPFRRCIECYYPRWYVPEWLGFYMPILIHNMAMTRCQWCRELCFLPTSTGVEGDAVVQTCPSLVVIEGRVDGGLTVDDWLSEGWAITEWMNSVSILF